MPTYNYTDSDLDERFAKAHSVKELNDNFPLAPSKPGAISMLAETDELRVVFTGSRGWRDISAIEDAFEILLPPPSPQVFLHVGDAKGADRLIYNHAMIFNSDGADNHVNNYGPYNIKVWVAGWKKYGKAAGHKRNDLMLATNPHIVIAFWDKKSPGTKSMIKKSLDKNITVACWRPDEMPVIL